MLPRSWSREVFRYGIAETVPGLGEKADRHQAESQGETELGNPGGDIKKGQRAKFLLVEDKSPGDRSKQRANRGGESIRAAEANGADAVGHQPQDRVDANMFIQSGGQQSARHRYPQHQMADEVFAAEKGKGEEIPQEDLTASQHQEANDQQNQDEVLEPVEVAFQGGAA